MATSVNLPRRGLDVRPVHPRRRLATRCHRPCPLSLPLLFPIWFEASAVWRRAGYTKKATSMRWLGWIGAVQTGIPVTLGALVLVFFVLRRATG